MKSNDIAALADAIVQSEELGWPLADTLERQADRMAAERILQAQSKAGAAGVLVMIPSTLVLLAAIILSLRADPRAVHAGGNEVEVVQSCEVPKVFACSWLCTSDSRTARSG